MTCETCFDTGTIDQGGREIACPACQTVTVKLTGLSHGVGSYGDRYATATAWTASTITFEAASFGAILADVTAVEREAKRGVKGRSHKSSWAIAIAKRIRVA